jgi:hypothetical protein
MVYKKEHIDYDFGDFVVDVKAAVSSQVPFMYCCNSERLAIAFLECCQNICQYSENPVEGNVEFSCTVDGWRIKRQNGLTITAIVR